MLSGKYINRLFIITLVAVVAACKDDADKQVSFLSPAEGARLTAGENIVLKTDVSPGEFDSIKYLLDSKRIASRRDTQSVSIPTKGLSFGWRLLTAVIYSGSDSMEINTNVQLLPANAPAQLSYEVLNTYPHDTTSYTQGLEFHDGIFYESDGERGESSLRKVDWKTGRVLKKVDIPAPIFAEGITLVDDKIVMLTYQERVGFVYDKQMLTKLSEFPLTSGTGEGWGLAFDGTYLLMTDGSNTIYRLNKDTYQIASSFEVFDNNGPVNNLNELEIINGKIYANIYQTDRIVIINPETGGVESEINLETLAPYPDRFETGYVLNGIAWDAKGERLFVTGKKWDKVFEIRIK